MCLVKAGYINKPIDRKHTVGTKLFAAPLKGSPLAYRSCGSICLPLDADNIMDMPQL